ncbi:recombinase family protein [Pararhodobacter sp. SW119]|uniref:recombinase family protein n=1 Tax=Pararhodobacter sp. SW119 TaxID=2780075 RepID=UPI001AE02331|nr:recombinase family protein [Pararhodobacter sp. SW119]
MIRYALATYGRRPSSSDAWKEHPEIWTQLVLTKVLATKQGHEVLGVAFDYHRAPRTLADLPQLRSALTRAKQLRSCVMVDTLGRLLRAAAPAHREALLAELRSFGEHLYCAQSKARLREIEDAWISMLIDTPGLERQLAHASRKMTGENPKQTESARERSGATRRVRSQKIARQLDAIRTALRAAGRNGTGEEIAVVANERGLRTQRGTEWSGATVRQALRNQHRAASAASSPSKNCMGESCV